MGLRVICSSFSPQAGEPPHRDTGFGPPVLCLHCSTGSASQWYGLSDLLCRRHRVMAPDLLGYGASPRWPLGGTLTLMDEVCRIEPLLRAARGPVHLVGHSFGAAVAVQVATVHPQLVRTLSIYEPVLIGLLRDDAASTTALCEIREVDAMMRRALRRGDDEGAARVFIDYWSGDGSWDRMPADRQASVRHSLPKVCADFEALFDDSVSLDAIARLEMPVLCLRGSRAPAPTRRIVERLAGANPAISLEVIPDAGHMGPLTHAGAVNARIERFVGAHSVEMPCDGPARDASAHAA